MIKKILPWFVFISLLLFIIIGFASKDKLNQYISNTMVKNAAPEIINNGAAYIDSAYNYSTNGLNYQLTFLEFGATSCVACRKMEKVMEEVRSKYPEKVNVVFLNILKPESQMLMNYYGISVIPTQILLNKEGKKFFKHTGFYSFDELRKEFNYAYGFK